MKPWKTSLAQASSCQLVANTRIHQITRNHQQIVSLCKLQGHQESREQQEREWLCASSGSRSVLWWCCLHGGAGAVGGGVEGGAAGHQMDPLVLRPLLRSWMAAAWRLPGLRAPLLTPWPGLWARRCPAPPCTTCHASTSTSTSTSTCSNLHSTFLPSLADSLPLRDDFN